MENPNPKTKIVHPVPLKKEVAVLKDQIEHAYGMLAQADEILKEFKKAIDEHGKVMNALVDVVGPEAVQKALDDAELRNLQARAEHQRAALAQALAQGRAAPADQVTEQSVLTIVEYDKGEPIPPGYFQFPYIHLTDVLKKEILGKGIGARAATGVEGHEIEVTGIYIGVEPPEKAPEEKSEEKSEEPTSTTTSEEK